MIVLGWGGVFLADLDSPNPGFEDSPAIAFFMVVVAVLLIWAALSDGRN